MFPKGFCTFFLTLLVVVPCHANSNFVALMNSRVGTWEHQGEQTGPEKLKWTTQEVVTRKGSGASQRWESRQQIKFKDGEIRRDMMTTRLLRGGGWYTEGTYGKSWYYPDKKVKTIIKTPDGSARVARGSWTLKGRKAVSASYSVGGYKQTSTTTILSSKRWRLTGAASDGTKTVINARKLR